MATLTVLRFSRPDGAEKAVETLLTLREQQLIYVDGAAIVSWEWGRERPKTRHAAAIQGVDCPDSTFWGLLFGLIFFVPLLGNDSRSNDPFIQAVQAQVTEGTSALFTLTDASVDDRIVAAFEDEHLEVIATNLHAEIQTSLCCCSVNQIPV